MNLVTLDLIQVLQMDLEPLEIVNPEILSSLIPKLKNCRVNKLISRTNSSLSVNKCDCSKTNLVITVVFVCMVVAMLTLFFVFNSEIKGAADDYVEFMKDSPFLAIFLFMLAFIISTPF